MFHRALIFVSMALLPAGATRATAQTDRPSAAVGVITGGSANVNVGGQAAAARGDATDAGSALVEGSANVLINGKAAATVGDRTGCGGVTVGGSSNVFVNGKPLARAGDLTTGCAGK